MAVEKKGKWTMGAVIKEYLGIGKMFQSYFIGNKDL